MSAILERPPSDARWFILDVMRKGDEAAGAPAQ